MHLFIVSNVTLRQYSVNPSLRRGRKRGVGEGVWNPAHRRYFWWLSRFFLCLFLCLLMAFRDSSYVFLCAFFDGRTHDSALTLIYTPNKEKVFHQTNMEEGKTHKVDGVVIASTKHGLSFQPRRFVNPPPPLLSFYPSLILSRRATTSS